ncbi:MAG TPA: glycosyl transferase, partial [Candidatus Aminicenantes bacterium]|nr:glycosyl transferase [Candidatus Aminicenantes bacterium]
MADFYQTGVITTFHRLKTVGLDRMEQELVEFSRHRRIALVLPITPAELGSPAIQGIMKNLREIPYLNEIVITLGRTAEKEHFLQAREFFSSLPQRHRIIWASGPFLAARYQLLAENDLQVGGD